MSETLDRRIALLVGSGVSCAAGLSGIRSLSEEVASSVSSGEVALLNTVRAFASKTHGEGKDSYEDWFFVADQISQHLDRNFENPALLPIVESIRASIGPVDDQGLSHLSRVLCDEITRLVCSRLETGDADANAAFKGLDGEIAKRNVQVAIFSLNHDLLLERFLHSKRIPFYDCFDIHPETPDFRSFRFSREAFERAPLSLMKLHGSVNWRRYRPLRSRSANDKWRDEFFGIRLQENRQFEEMDDIPLVLLGTFNKILQYASPVFLQMLGEFHHFLQTCSNLIVCGYGFADKGINGLLAYWMSERIPRTMCVIDPNPFDPGRCRGAILDKVTIWEHEERLKKLPQKLGKGDTTWAEVFRFADL